MAARRTFRKTFAVAAAVALSVSVTGCGGGEEDSGGSTDAGGPVTMDFWHNATTGPGKAFWEKTVADFEDRQPERHDRDPVDPERGAGRQAPDRAELRRRARHLHAARRRQDGRDGRGRPG